MNRFDALIIGQGLAGTTLAWTLLMQECSVAIIDDPMLHSASRVAAGLVTPVTGRALRARPDFLRDLTACRDLYKSVEVCTGASLWTERAALRLFDAQDAVAKLRAAVAGSPELITHGGNVPAGLRAPAAVATMPPAARLDVPAYLRASRSAFNARCRVVHDRVAPDELRIGSAGVHIDRLNLTASCLVWCGGAHDADNAWLPLDALSPARGEIIEVRLTHVATADVVHRGGRWLRPLGNGHYQFGATYDHANPVAQTTAAARDALMAQLGEWVDGPVECIDQVAGVRPVARNRQPLLAAHPVHKRVFAFNGLGSHGVLIAPRCATSLANALPLGDPACA